MSLMKRRNFLLFAGCLLSSPSLAAEEDKSFLVNPDVIDFIDEMKNNYGFMPTQLEKMFSLLRFNKKVIRLMDKPATPGKKVYWREYRKKRLKSNNILLGVNFMKAHAADLKRAEETFGVPAEIITAILGVETRYGTYLGGFNIAEALATLAFFYPRRSAEFREQMKEFLLYSRESGIDVLSFRGSYAGAFGMPQFLPSSARSFAVDFDNNGTTNLFSPTDAIGSIGNFLKHYGWRQEHGVTYPANVSGNIEAVMTDSRENGYKPTFSRDELAAVGIHIDTETIDGENYLPVDLENRYDTEYRVGTDNFYALTRYNKSFKYAAAVFDLSLAIRDWQ